MRSTRPTASRGAASRSASRKSWAVRLRAGKKRRTSGDLRNDVCEAGRALHDTGSLRQDKGLPSFRIPLRRNSTQSSQTQGCDCCSQRDLQESLAAMADLNVLATKFLRDDPPTLAGWKFASHVARTPRKAGISKNEA